MTPLTLETLGLLIEGYSISDIARRLGQSEAVIESELEAVLRLIEDECSRNNQ